MQGRTIEIARAIGILAIVLAAAFAPPSAAATVNWEPGEVQYTLGSGHGEAPDAIVTFTSSVALRDVALSGPPVAEGFVNIAPQYFASVEANTPYTVRLRFAVPPGTRPNTLFKGKLSLFAAGTLVRAPLPVTVRIDYGDLVIPPTTKAISAQSVACLDSPPTAERLDFHCRALDLDAVAPGDVLVAGVNPQTPTGLLRRVLAVDRLPDRVLVDTAPAALEDALEDGTLAFQRVFTPEDIASAVASDGVSLAAKSSLVAGEGFFIEVNDLVLYDFDGTDSTEDDQVRANGSIALDPGIDFTFALSDRQITHVGLVGSITETLDLEVMAEITLDEFHRKHEVARYTMSPIVIWAGYVPVVFVPALTVNVGAEGSVTVGLTTSIEQEARLSAGISYDNGEWSRVADFLTDFEWSPPRLSTGLNIKTFAGPQFNLLLYGIAGPYFQTRGYFELDADLWRVPWWELWGGLEATAGVHVDLMGRSLVDYESPDLIGYRTLLAQAPEAEPGNIAGKVSDALSRVPLDQVSVKVKDGVAVVSEGRTGQDGTFSVIVQPGDNYTVVFEKTGYLPVTYYSVEVREAETTHLQPVLQIDESHSGLGSVGGIVVNALSGAGVPGLSIQLRPGLNARTGPVVAVTTTGGGGIYHVTNLTAGSYTGEASGIGYLTTYFSIICIGGLDNGNQNATITPELPPGELRIVLTWGASPSDLDSHCTGPLPSGSRFHMYYPYSAGSSPWPTFVTLDRDDVTSYGPETTTILQQIPGVYRFSVHDFTNRGSTSSTALSASAAQVMVYGGSGLLAVFNVPVNQGGTLWTVFELDDGTITPVNAMSYQSSPGSVGFGAPEIDWQHLPPKP